MALTISLCEQYTLYIGFVNKKVAEINLQLLGVWGYEKRIFFLFMLDLANPFLFLFRLRPI